MFLIIGFKKHTKDNPNIITYKNGKPFEYEYIEEKCIASGNNKEELIKDVKEYVRISKMNTIQYLYETINKKTKRKKS